MNSNSVCIWEEAGIPTKNTHLFQFSLLLLCIPLSHKNLRLLLLPGNKRDRIETLTQCAECSQFVEVSYFFPVIWPTLLAVFRSSTTSCKISYTKSLHESKHFPHDVIASWACSTQRVHSLLLYHIHVGMWRIPNLTESDTFPKIRNPSDT